MYVYTCAFAHEISAPTFLLDQTSEGNRRLQSYMTSVTKNTVRFPYSFPPTAPVISVKYYEGSVNPSGQVGFLGY